MGTGSILAKILLSKFKTGSESVTYTDPTYLPFFNFLGEYLPNCKSLIEIGFDLGMPSGAFLMSCPGVEHFLAFRKKGDFLGKRLGLANIYNIWRKKFSLWVGEESDPEFIRLILNRKWDCVIISDPGRKEETYQAYLNLVWGSVSDEGVVAVDYLRSPEVWSAYSSFCKAHRLEPTFVDTVRGTGIIRK